jgi:hypothetical protein
MGGYAGVSKKYSICKKKPKSLYPALLFRLFLFSVFVTIPHAPYIYQHFSRIIPFLSLQFFTLKKVVIYQGIADESPRKREAENVENT